MLTRTSLVDKIMERGMDGGLSASVLKRECGGRNLGEEVMACSGFGVLYNVIVGFDEMEELAVKLVKAFEESGCSIEVKSMARHAATYYHLDQLPQLKEFLP